MTGPVPPPPGGPAPVWVPPGLPPRRRHSSWLVVGLPVAGGLLLLGGFATVVVLFVRAVGGEVGPAGGAGERYARALVDGRWDDAHAGLCAEVQADVTPDELAAHYTDPDVTGYGLDGVDVRSSGGRTSAQVTVTLRYADGLQDHLVLPLTDEDGSWRPCP